MWLRIQKYFFIRYWRRWRKSFCERDSLVLTYMNKNLLLPFTLISYHDYDLGRLCRPMTEPWQLVHLFHSWIRCSGISNRKYWRQTLKLNGVTIDLKLLTNCILSARNKKQNIYDCLLPHEFRFELSWSTIFFFFVALTFDPVTSKSTNIFPSSTDSIKHWI